MGERSVGADPAAVLPGAVIPGRKGPKAQGAAGGGSGAEAAVAFAAAAGSPAGGGARPESLEGGVGQSLGGSGPTAPSGGKGRKGTSPALGKGSGGQISGLPDGSKRSPVAPLDDNTGLAGGCDEKEGLVAQGPKSRAVGEETLEERSMKEDMMHCPITQVMVLSAFRVATIEQVRHILSIK